MFSFYYFITVIIENLSPAAKNLSQIKNDKADLKQLTKIIVIVNASLFLKNCRNVSYKYPRTCFNISVQFLLNCIFNGCALCRQLLQDQKLFEQFQK